MLKWLRSWWSKNHDSVERVAAAEVIAAALIPLTKEEAVAVLEAALADVRTNK